MPFCRYIEPNSSVLTHQARDGTGPTLTKGPSAPVPCQVTRELRVSFLSESSLCHYVNKLRHGKTASVQIID